MVEVEYSERAADWLRNAEPDVREQVVKRIEQAAEFPEHFLRRLSDASNYRLRAGDYRVIIDWRRDDDVLLVSRIGHRRNVYDY